MAARANYVKLGLFVVIALAAAIGLAVAVGSTLHVRRATIAYVTYFNESVDGVDVGSQVKARGVKVGRVGNVAFAPDHEMVEVRMDFDAAAIKEMGGSQQLTRPNVRAQLASQGLVGERFISIDLFDQGAQPPPDLKFVPPTHYIPSTPSLQKSLEASAAKTLDRLSLLADSMVQERVVERTSHAVGELDALLSSVRATVRKVNEALGRGDGDEGLLTGAQQALASAGEIGRNTSAGTRDLRAVLDELRAAAAAIRELAEQIQQNPDMLVKGRSNP